MAVAPSPVLVVGHRLDDLLELCHSGRLDRQFLGELAARLRRLIPFDASLFVATDPDTTLPAPPVRLNNLDEDCRAFWERELLVEDVLLYRDLARRQVPAGSIQDETGGHPGRSARHRELNDPSGFDDELRVAFRQGSRCWGVASLWRFKGRPHFSPSEVDLLARLSAPIANAFRHGLLNWAQTAPPTPTGPGLLVFDPMGQLASLNEDATGWLGELRTDLDHDGEQRLSIPTEVYSVVSQARAVAVGRSAAPARTRVRSRNGGWLTLHASCLSRGDGEIGDTAVIIEPAHPSELAPIILQAYGLTDREQDVTNMIAQGHDTAQIANLLCLSPHTVRGYVKTVFEKVGVGSRGEMVARLFADHYYEPLHR